MFQLNMELRLTPLSLTLLCILSCWLQEAVLLQGFSLSFRNEEGKRKKGFLAVTYSCLTNQSCRSPLGLKKLIMIK